MTSPRAVGVRAPYAGVPERVRRWVDQALGSPVVEAREQTGGMSPGCATRLLCADGTRAFVKAVGTELNPDTPTMFRRESLALTLLGSHALWADLLATYDDGAWVGLLLEDVEGKHPDLADDDVMDRLVRSTDELAGEIRARVRRPPVPAPETGGLNDLRLAFSRWAGSLDHAADLPPGSIPRWVVERAAELQRGVLLLTQEPAETVVHWDIRNDNLLQRTTGEIVFLDWGACGVGPAWLDPLLARLERVESPWFDASLSSSPALAGAGDEKVTSWLVGIGTFLAWRAHTAVDVNLPTLNDFRRTESSRFLGAAARRMGVS